MPAVRGHESDAHHGLVDPVDESGQGLRPAPESELSDLPDGGLVVPVGEPFGEPVEEPLRIGVHLAHEAVALARVGVERPRSLLQFQDPGPLPT